MSDRALKVIVKVLGGLVVLWGIAFLIGRGGSDAGSQEGSGAMAAFFDDISAGDIRAMVLSGPSLDEPVRLERLQTDWSVNGHPADSGFVARFLSELEGAEVGDIFSTNSANHSRMGVSADSAVVVVIEAAGSTDTLFLGSPGPGFGAVFARIPGEDEVRLVSGDLRSPARRTLDQWRSKRILALDTASIQSIEVERDGESFELVRSDAGWSVDGESADSATVALLLGELRSLQASSFAEDQTVFEGDPDRTVLIRGSDGAPIATVRLWNPPEGATGNLSARTEGQVSEAGAGYSVASWRADRLAPERSRILPPDDEGGSG